MILSDLLDSQSSPSWSSFAGFCFCAGLCSYSVFEPPKGKDTQLLLQSTSAGASVTTISVPSIGPRGG